MAASKVELPPAMSRGAKAETITIRREVGFGVTAKDVQKLRKAWTIPRCDEFLEKHGKKLVDAMALAAWHYLESALAFEDARRQAPSHWQQFEVEFKDLTGKCRFTDEYGFGENPPAVFFAESEDALRKRLAPMMKRDKVEIVSVERVS